MTDPNCGPRNQNFYLGNPGAPVVQLTLPDGGYTNTLDTGRVDHTLLSGYHAVQRTGRVTRAYGLSFSALGVDTADQIISILYGLLGPAPYFFVDPAWRNVLASHTSSAGKLTQSSAGFALSGAGALAYTAAVAPPAAAALSGVQAWTGAGASSELWIGASAPQILERSCVPALSMLPQTYAVWLRSASGAPNIAIDAYFNDANGAYLSSTPLAAVNALSSTWKRFAGTLPAASIPAAAVGVGFALRCTTAAAPAIYVSAAGAQFVAASVGAALSSLPPWVLGMPVPRMLPSGTSPANATAVWWRKNHALTLVEAA